MVSLRVAASGALSLAALLGLVACETNSVALMGRAPAGSYDASQLRTIAVLDFDHPDGWSFTGLLRAELQNASLDGQPWFTLVSDDALLADAGFRHRWRGPDVQAALAAARERGIDAVYVGEVLSADVSGSSSEEEHSRCTEWDGLFDCETREKYWTICHHLAARYAVGLEVIDVRTGGLALADAFDGHASDRYCDDESRWTDPGTLMAQARQSVASQIRHAVAPSNVTLHAELKPTAAELGEPGAAAFASGVEWARAGDLSRACAIWRELAPGDVTTSAALLQNLGVCAEAAGDHTRAAALYAAADAQLTEPDADVARARQRVSDQALALQLTR